MEEPRRGRPTGDNTKMNKTHRTLAAIAAVFAGAVLTGPAALAQDGKKKDNSDLAKVGRRIGHESGRIARATEYGVRKGGENVKVESNRAAGRDSKVRNRGAKRDVIITPEGKRVPVQKGRQTPRKP